MYVHEGYAAISVGINNTRWIGVIKGNIFCKKTRKSTKRALKDAEKLYRKHNK